MYPMASNVASFSVSVLVSFEVFKHKLLRRSGHKFCGSSAEAIPAIHDAADEGFAVSVPRDLNTYKLKKGNFSILILEAKFNYHFEKNSNAKKYY